MKGHLGARALLSHGVKEQLVSHIREWPGLQSVRQLADGEPLAGTWFDRTQEYLARRKGEAVDRLRYATPETVIFSPLPCWEHLSPEAYRQRVANMAAEIEEDAAVVRTRTGPSRSESRPSWLRTRQAAPSG